MGYLYKPKLRSAGQSGIWWAKYYVNGKAVRESTKADNHEQARRFLKLREGAAATGAPIPPRVDRITYDELAADLRTHYETTGRWKNLDDVDRRLAHLNGFFKGYRAVSVTPDMLARYVAKRQAETTHIVASRDGK